MNFKFNFDVLNYQEVKPHPYINIYDPDVYVKADRPEPELHTIHGRFRAYYTVGVKIDGASLIMHATIGRKLLEEWHIALVDLCHDAMSEMIARDGVEFHTILDVIRGIDEPLAEMAEECWPKPSNDCPDLYVLTNRTNHRAASLILSPEVRASIAEELGCGFYACPSSIHEMVIIPNKGDVLSLDDMRKMVRDINAEYVSEEEILSDKVIKCDNCGNIIG